MALPVSGSGQLAPASSKRIRTDRIPPEAALRLLRVLLVSGSLLTLALLALLWLLL